MFCSNEIFILPHLLRVLEQINVIMGLISILLWFKLINIHYHIKKTKLDVNSVVYMLHCFIKSWSDRELVDQQSYDPPFPTVFL